MVTLSNDKLTVQINPKGAELTSLVSKESGLEYMWSGDPAVWGKHSPVLFPIVGTLKNNTYLYNGRSYELPRHGFARERVFVSDSHTSDEAIFSLHADDSTRAVFPFEFALRMKYSILGNALSVTYEVENTGKSDLYFSVGAHPAFKLPLVDGTAYEDHYLEFESNETAGRWPISPDGLIEKTSQPLLENTNALPLNKDLFSKDALVLKNLKSSSLSLKSAKTEHGLTFDFPGFPYLGLWAARGADFLCIEPWCGIADPVDTNQEFTGKEGICHLIRGEMFHRTWTVTIR